jgi:ribosomal protein S18 acetylase RimI-like enzyme
MSPRTSVRLVQRDRDVEAVRSLFAEYRKWLAEHREVTVFEDSVLKTGLRYFDEEIRALPGAYGPPRGALYLAFEGTTPVGCGALRQLGPHVGEIKRLYVRPDSRGSRLGRRITRALLNRARTLGYDRVVLDTLPNMKAAIAIYRSMGFEPIQPYWAHPYPDALFFEYRLRGRTGSLALNPD